MELFLQGMQFPEQDLAELSAVYLKKKYIDGPEIEKIEPEKMLYLQQTVLATMKPEKKVSFLRRGAEILAKIFLTQNKITEIFAMVNHFYS
jgi:hypothetical protein